MLTTKGKVSGTSKKGRSAELMRKLKYELDFDALEELIKMYRGKGSKPSDKMKIALELMSYQYPKIKAVELTHNAGENVVFNIDISGAKSPVTTPEVVDEITEDA